MMIFAQRVCGPWWCTMRRFSGLGRKKAFSWERGRDGEIAVIRWMIHSWANIAQILARHSLLPRPGGRLPLGAMARW